MKPAVTSKCTEIRFLLVRGTEATGAVNGNDGEVALFGRLASTVGEGGRQGDALKVPSRLSCGGRAKTGGWEPGRAAKSTASNPGGGFLTFPGDLITEGGVDPERPFSSCGKP